MLFENQQVDPQVDDYMSLTVGTRGWRPFSVIRTDDPGEFALLVAHIPVVCVRLNLKRSSNAFELLHPLLLPIEKAF